ncbi:MAG TPA: PAS domain S-box protein [archaeon]|nr:PAS domain S-box protein [archaeon]
MIDVGEEQHKSYELLFRSIYMDSPIGIEIYDSNGKLVDLNNSCMELFGVLKKDDIRGFDLLKDITIPIEHIARLKHGETVKVESSFDFDLVRNHKLFDTSKTGKIYFELIITPLFLGDDKSISNYLVQIQDISDHKRSEQKLIEFNKNLENQIQDRTEQLRKSKEKFRYLINNLSDVIIESNLDSTFTYASPRIFNLLGYRKEEIIGMKEFDFIHPEDLERIQKERKRAIESNEKAYVEYKMKHKKGYYVPVSTAWNNVSIDGQVKIIGEIRDISEFTKIKEEVRDSEKRLKNLIEAIPVGITLTSFDDKIFDCNSQAVKMLGYDSKEEFLEMSALDLYNNPNDRVKFLELHRGGLVKDFDVLAKRKDGSTFWISITSKKQITENQTSFINTFQDITERKMTGQKLKEREERLRRIFDTVEEGIILIEPDGQIVQANPAAETILGLKHSDIESRNYIGSDWEILRQDGSLMPLEEMPGPRAMKEKKIIKNIEMGVRKPDNTISWINVSAAPITDEKGKFYGVVSTFLDLTHRKNAEQSLRESEERFRLTFENAAIGIAHNGLDGTFLKVNQGLCDIVKYSREELHNLTFHEITHPDDLEADLEYVSQLLDNKIQSFMMEKRYIRKDKSIVWVNLTGSLVREQSGEPKYFIAVIEDITKRKLATQKLKESERRYKELIEAIPVGISITTPEGKNLECNSQAYKIFGYESKESFLQTPVLDLYYDYNDREKLIELHENEILKEFEVRYKHKDGTLFWSSLTSIKQKIEDQTVHINSFQDITERKEREEDIRLHGEIMTNISEGVHLVRLDDGIIVYSNPALEEMFGYNPGEMIGKDIAIVNAPTDKTPEKTKDSIMGILAETGEWHGEIKNIKKDGTIFWCYANVSLFDHPKYGKVLVSAHTDITKRKKAQKKLIESEMRYKHLANEMEMILDYLPGLIFYKDASNKFLRVNKYLADAHNMTKEELSGMSLFDMYPQEQAQAYWDDDLEVIKSGNAKLNIEEPWDTDEGRKWVSTSKIPFFNEKGKVTGIIGLSFDITERKKAEEKLKESEEKFRTLAEQSSLGLIIQQDDKIKFANRTVSNIIEYPLQEINDWTVEDTFKIIHADDLQYVKEKVSEREEGDYEKILKYECRVITKSGKLKWVEIVSKALTYLGKHALAITMIDITIQKEWEEELKEISKLKSELLSRTSHELKTPLVSIKGYVDLLLQVHYENLDFYTISMLHEIRRGCSRLESLIKDLLETSQLETGEIVLRKERENLSFLIKFCLKELQGLANIRHHKILVNIDENMITMFEKERIYEVIVNLLSNAIKYTPPKGVIKIGSEVKNNNYIISIEDNGIGLSETDKQKLFKKFGKIERYGKGLDVVSEGSGLGLYISKGMIELHEGEIWVESKGNDKGSTFYFSLPIIND